MNKWLHQNDFSYKQPKGIPHKFDDVKQHKFIASYDALKKYCSIDESIIFMDAVHPQATKLSHSWILTGQNKTFETIGHRSCLNIVGGLNLTDISRTVICKYDRITDIATTLTFKFNKY